jgi:hypothetical protein
MARPTVPESKKSRSAGISLPPAILKRSKKFAASRNKSLSALVLELLVEATQPAEKERA